MPDRPESQHESQPDPVLASLARTAATRAGAPACAVRDATGRTYASAAVRLPSFALSAVRAAVAQAAAAGAVELEGAVLADGEPDDDDRAALRDLRCPSVVLLDGGRPVGEVVP